GSRRSLRIRAVKGCSKPDLRYDVLTPYLRRCSSSRRDGRRIDTTPSAANLDTPSRSVRACYVHHASGSRGLAAPSTSSCLPCVFDELADAIAALAGALGAFDAERVELALDIAEDEVSPLWHDDDIITVL